MASTAFLIFRFYLNYFQPKHPQSLLKQKPVTHTTILVTNPVVTSAGLPTCSAAAATTVITSTTTSNIQSSQPQQQSLLTTAGGGAKLLYSRLSAPPTTGGTTTTTTTTTSANISQQQQSVSNSTGGVDAAVVGGASGNGIIKSEINGSDFNSGTSSPFGGFSANRALIQTSLISSQPVSAKEKKLKNLEL